MASRLLESALKRVELQLALGTLGSGSWTVFTSMYGERFQAQRTMSQAAAPIPSRRARLPRQVQVFPCHNRRRYHGGRLQEEACLGVSGPPPSPARAGVFFALTR